MKRWKMVKMREVVSHRKEFITILEHREYARCRVQTAARGIVLRDKVLGADIKTPRQQVCKQREFLVAEIDAKVGGFGIVPTELDGAIVSSHYFLYSVNEARLLPEFLDWYCRTSFFLQQVRARGSTNYASIRAIDVLEYEIPLPELSEQAAIVRRLTEISSLSETRRVAAEASEKEANELLSSAFRRAIENARYIPMHEVAPLVRRPVQVHVEGAYAELGVRSFGRGTFHKPALAGADVGSKRIFYIRDQDLVFNIVFAWEGAVAVAQEQDDGRVGSHRFLTCVPHPDVALASFLRFYFLTSEGLRKLNEASPGGAGRNRTLNIKKLEEIQVPVPDFAKQKSFERLETLVTEMRTVRERTNKEAEQLLPAVLYRIFASHTAAEILDAVTEISSSSKPSKLESRKRANG